MKSAVLFILGAILVSVLLSKLAKYFLAKMENKKIEELLEQERKFACDKKEFVQPREIIYVENIKFIKPRPIYHENFCESKEVKTHKKPNEFKEVLNKQNSSASRKPNDYHDKQNLDPKFSPNVYRGKNGRFKSKKQWNKEQKTS